eukprot:9579640-Karenia_brevis.AAC.1
MRGAQRHQATIRGYFGGYINKRQPSGKLDTWKCVRKMQTSKQSIKSRTSTQQLRAVSGRLVTDLEMKSTYRGA